MAWRRAMKQPASPDGCRGNLFWGTISTTILEFDESRPARRSEPGERLGMPYHGLRGVTSTTVGGDGSGCRAGRLLWFCDIGPLVHEAWPMLPRAKATKMVK